MLMIILIVTCFLRLWSKGLRYERRAFQSYDSTQNVHLDALQKNYNDLVFTCLKHIKKLIEQVVGIMVPRTGLRVVLHRKDVLVPDPKPGHGTIVQMGMGDLDFRMGIGLFPVERE